VKDGETVVIGGLVRNRRARVETKVPLLGDIPLLGVLFRTRSDQDEKSNLILVLTPHIVRDQADMKRILAKRMEERTELLERETIFSDDKWSPPHDWARKRGLLGEIRQSQLAVEEKRREEEERAPKGDAPLAPPPLDLPVPQGPGAHSAPPHAAPTPAKPTVIER
jgi:general secretion pathway protein D